MSYLGKVTVLETGSGIYAATGEYRGSAADMMSGPHKNRFVPVSHAEAEALEIEDLQAGEIDVLDAETVSDNARELYLKIREAEYAEHTRGMVIPAAPA